MPLLPLFGSIVVGLVAGFWIVYSFALSLRAQAQAEAVTPEREPRAGVSPSPLSRTEEPMGYVSERPAHVSDEAFDELSHLSPPKPDRSVRTHSEHL